MSTIRQKKIAIVNDVTGFGRCSVAVALPIISALKVQGCILPTAIFSSHTGFEHFFFEDYTSKMNAYINKWEQLNLSFDGIYTGFLGSKEQIEIVCNFLEKFKTKDTIAIIDPVMGDYGEIYPTYTKEMCDEMKRLVKFADVMTPNLTEVCNLLDIDYPKEMLSYEELEKLAHNLAIQGPKKIVITGLQRNDGYIENFVYEEGKPYSIVRAKKIGIDRSGTGDVFCSIIAADAVNGINFVESVKKTSNFISKCLEFTTKLNMPSNYGVCFEEFLTELK